MKRIALSRRQQGAGRRVSYVNSSGPSGSHQRLFHRLITLLGRQRESSPAPIRKAPSVAFPGARSIERAAAVPVLIFLASVAAMAQVSTATMTGVVQDPSGAVVPGASIVATQTQTNTVTHAVTDSSGVFSLPSLPVGLYLLNVTAPGFAPYAQTGIVLTVGQVANFNVRLPVGQTTQGVTVSAAAPTIDPTTSTISTTIDQNAVVNIPLNGRNPATLVFDAGGVANAGQNLGTGQLAATSVVIPSFSIQGSIAPAVNGVVSGGTYFSLDGASNTDPSSMIGGPFPNPDATQEFQVVTGTYGSQYQSAPGGAINIVTRAGTNKFHGTIFEFIRNGYFNAENAILAQPDTLKRNQYGATIGGPIFKNRLFFFGSYQGTRIASQTVTANPVPTAAERQGIFQACAATTCNASNEFPLDITTLPPIAGPNFESPVNANFYNYMGSGNSLIPLANSPGNFYTIGVPTHTNDEQWVARLDYQQGEHHRLFARYFFDHQTVPAKAVSTTPPYNLFDTLPGGQNFWDDAAVGDTWTPNQSWVLDSRLSYLNIVYTTASPAANGYFNYPSFGAQNYSIPADGSLGITVVGNLIPPAGSGTVDTPRESLDLNEDVIHNLGNHEISFGGGYRHSRFAQGNPAGQTGVVIYAGVYSGIAAGILGLSLVDAPYADFYLGHPIEFIQSDGFFNSSIANIFGLYLQDKWRASQRLTLTYGMRWDPFLPYAPEHHQIDCFRVGEQSTVYPNAFTGFVYPGDPGCSDGGTTTKWKEFQPRLGVAYQLDQKGTTAVRAGYGVYVIQVPLDYTQGFAAQPWVRQFEITNPFQNIQNIWSTYPQTGGKDPFATGFHNFGYLPPADASFTPGTNYGNITPNFGPGYVQQYSLSIQRALTNSDSLEIAYVGTKGTHMGQSYDLNQPVPSSSPVPFTRPYGNVNQIITADNIGYSNYSSAQVTYNHRNAGGVNLHSVFTWSKCIDDGSNPVSTGGLSQAVYAPANFERGRCDFDLPLSWRNILVYTAPKLDTHDAAMRTVLGGWMMSGNFVLDAGFPFSITEGSNASESQTTLDRADYVPGQQPYVNGKLNYNAFTQNAAGTFGDSPRNGFRSVPNYQIDAALLKNFRLTERFTLMFRAEAFNIINHPNYYDPLNELSSANPSNFGAYQAARDPRQLQFALKLMF
jgi:hypothetical protein